MKWKVIKVHRENSPNQNVDLGLERNLNALSDDDWKIYKILSRMDHNTTHYTFTIVAFRREDFDLPPISGDSGDLATAPFERVDDEGNPLSRDEPLTN